LAIVIGLSRGGFVGLVCAIGYMVMKSPRKQMAIIVIVLIAGLLALVAGPSYWEEMSTITDPNEGTADLRLEFWKIAFQEFLAYPLTGVGGDNYRWQMENFQSLEQTQKFDRVLSSHVHSTYFQLLSELGLAGCITFGFIMFRTYQDYRYIDRLTSQSLTDANKVEDNVLQEDAVWIRNYGRGLIGALLGYMVSVAFLSALYYSHLWIIVSLVIALRAIASRQLGSSSIKESNLAQSGNIFKVPRPVAARS
jgi:putative inorganic carbon (hco3(-)) transporter